MSPVLIDGNQLGVAVNGTFTEANTDPIPFGRLWNGSGGPRGDLGAAQSWNDMRAYIGARHNVWIVPNGPNSSARSRAAQLYFWNHQPPAAAPHPPQYYSSNHGWGLAVDVDTQTMAAYLLRYGAMFGWSHDEGARVGEWWHFRYVGGYRKRIVADPLNRQEQRLLAEYGAAAPARKQEILNAVARDIRAVRRRARAEPSGWTKHKRGARYEKLTAWFNGQFPRWLTARERAEIARFYGADPAQKRASLARIRALAHAVQQAARAEQHGWELFNRGQRYQYLAQFHASHVHTH